MTSDRTAMPPIAGRMRGTIEPRRTKNTSQTVGLSRTIIGLAALEVAERSAGSRPALHRRADRRLGLVLGLEDVRRDAALRQPLAELGAHERARREPGDSVEVFVADLPYGIVVGILDRPVELEAVVVDDCVH